MKRKGYLLALSLCLLGLSANAQYQRAGFLGGNVNTIYESAGQFFAASSGGVFMSSDQGKTWVNTSVPDNIFGSDEVTSIAASPNEMFAATANLGVFKSTDAGATWSSVGTNLKKANAKYSDLEIIGANTLLIRPDSNLLYLTTDQGTSWQLVTVPINNSRAFSLSKRNGILYVVTNTGLYSSGNDGLNYLNINPGVTNGKLYWANDTAYLATSNGVMQSLDFGMTFIPAGLTGRNVSNVAAFGPNIFASVTSTSGVDTVKYSNDGGANYVNAAANSGGNFAFRKVNDFIVSDTTVLLGTNYDLYGSHDAGHSWQSSSAGLYATAVIGIAASNKNLYAATPPRGIYKSTDSSRTWQHVGNYANGLGGDIISIDAKPGFVFAGDSNSFYRSLDSGTTWTKVTLGVGSGAVRSIFAVPNTNNVWMIQGGNFYLSSDNGATFIAVPSAGIVPNTADFLTGIDTNLFINAGLGFYHAGGNNVFIQTTRILAPVTSVVSHNGMFYASSNGAGLYSSLDGNTWTALSSTLPPNIFALTVDSGNLVAGTSDGIYRELAGVWTADTFQGTIVRSFFEDNNHLLVGTCGDLFTKPYPPQKWDVGVPKLLASFPIHVFPNPMERNAQCSIKSQEAGPAQLTLRDMTGKLLEAKSLQLSTGDNVFEFHCSMPTGIYLLNVTTRSERFSQRIIVK